MVLILGVFSIDSCAKKRCSGDQEVLGYCFLKAEMNPVILGISSAHPTKSLPKCQAIANLWV